MNQTLGTAYACLYCPAVFVSPNARRIHLEEQHGETVDASGAQAAVAQLQALLKQTKARYDDLQQRRLSE